ncbi:MAG: type II secretion system protein [Patescibacteria group bacterium]
MKKYKTKKGFTLIELLLVIAIIAILSTMILMMLDSGREKAEINRYKSYAVQMYRLVGDTVTAGYFDGMTNDASVSTGAEYCLGDYNNKCGRGDNNDVIDEALLKFAETFPSTEHAYSPYNDAKGVTMEFADETTIRVKMYLTSRDSEFVSNVCNNMKWNAPCESTSCCIDVPISNRYDS